MSYEREGLEDKIQGEGIVDKYEGHGKGEYSMGMREGPEDNI